MAQKLTEAEFLAAKKALLEIIEAHEQPDRTRLKATEDLLALIETYENCKWLP